jgi:hypothetical protein
LGGGGGGGGDAGVSGIGFGRGKPLLLSFGPDLTTVSSCGLTDDKDDDDDDDDDVDVVVVAAAIVGGGGGCCGGGGVVLSFVSGMIFVSFVTVTVSDGDFELISILTADEAIDVGGVDGVLTLDDDVDDEDVDLCGTELVLL